MPPETEFAGAPALLPEQGPLLSSVKCGAPEDLPQQALLRLVGRQHRNRLEVALERRPQACSMLMTRRECRPSGVGKVISWKCPAAAHAGLWHTCLIAFVTEGPTGHEFPGQALQCQAPECSAALSTSCGCQAYMAVRPHEDHDSSRAQNGMSTSAHRHTGRRPALPRTRWQEMRRRRRCRARGPRGSCRTQSAGSTAAGGMLPRCKYAAESVSISTTEITILSWLLPSLSMCSSVHRVELPMV